MITLEPQQPVQYACIVLHGLGADGSDLQPLAPGLWPNPQVRWLFPNAPIRPITLNGGLRMRGWYDISSTRIADSDDSEGINASADYINELIDQQAADSIYPERVIIVGFSQGGVMALHVTTRRTKPLAACVALSCYLPFADKLAEQAVSASKTTPIFCAGGTADPVIAIADTALAVEQLSKTGYQVQFRQYPMEHNIIPAEISDIGEFLTEKIPPAL